MLARLARRSIALLPTRARQLGETKRDLFRALPSLGPRLGGARIEVSTIWLRLAVCVSKPFACELEIPLERNGSSLSSIWLPVCT